jgi:LysM repeat protein
MSGEKKSAPKKKAATKKAAVKKAAPSKPSAPATSKSATVAEPATKPATKKPAPKKKAAAKKTSTPKVTRPTDASLTKMEDDYINKTRERLIKEGKLSGSKEIAIRPKGEVVSKAKPVVQTSTVKPIPGSDTVVKKKGLLRKIGGKFVPLVVAGEVVSIAKGSTNKDLNEIQRLKQKLDGKNIGAKEGAATQISNLANLLTMGAVGQTRRERMDELNAKIKKKEAANKKANKGLRYGPDGSSLVPGTAAYKAGSKTRPVKPVAPGAAGGASGGASGGKSGTTTGAGGSTITATPGSTYTVKKGDTLSAIAKASGVSLTEIRKANKKFTTNPKYKQGNMIWSGTKVNIPKK